MSEPAGRPSGSDGKPPEPQGKSLGMPYDWREPTAERIAARQWNPGDPRLFTPKAYGLGYTVNFYWLFHPLRYIRR